MTNYVVESGIPTPEGPLRRGKHPVYPFAKLQVGDSFVGPPKARTAAYQWSQRHAGVTFSSQLQPDGQCRIWRRT